MHVKVSKDDIIVGSTDGRGRIYLGTEHANESVEIAILNADD